MITFQVPVLYKKNAGAFRVHSGTSILKASHRRMLAHFLGFSRNRPPNPSSATSSLYVVPKDKPAKVEIATDLLKLGYLRTDPTHPEDSYALWAQVTREGALAFFPPGTDPALLPIESFPLRDNNETAQSSPTE